MLFAYESGILPASDIRDLELHLMECNHCFEKAQRFERASRLIKFDKDVREAILLDANEKKKTSRGLFSIPVLAAAAIILIFLVIKPWQVEIHTTQSAFANDNRLAVLYFENMTDATDSLKTAEIATNLLITDLSQFSQFTVLSSQRIADAMTSLGYSKDAVLEKSIALAVAREASARWILSGSILQTSPNFIITTQLIDVSSGKVLSSHKETGVPADDIFSIIDKTGAVVRNDIPISNAAHSEENIPVEQMTTHSIEAYRLFLEGKEYFEKLYVVEAIEKFREALDIDSTMAMAYYYLSFYLPQEEMKDVIARAVAYSEKLPENQYRLIRARNFELEENFAKAMEQYHILIRRYPDDKEALLHLALNEFFSDMNELAMIHLKEILRIDHYNKSAYNQLAYSAMRLGKLDEALQYANEYLNLVPDEANPYDTKAEILLALKMPDSAIAALQKALEIKPDYSQVHLRLANVYLQRGDYEKAEAHYKEVLRGSRGRYRQVAALYPAIITMKQGHFGEALRHLDSLEQDIFGRQESNYNKTMMASIVFLKARTYEAIGVPERGLSGLRTYGNLLSPLGIHEDAKYRFYYYQLLAETGRFDVLRTEVESVKRLGYELQDGSKEKYYIDGITAFYQRDYSSAIAFLNKSLGSEQDFFGYYMLGRAYLQAKQPDSAIAAFHVLDWSEYTAQLYNDIWDVMRFYYLGKAYRDTGRTDEAIEYLQRFMSFWHKADSGNPEVENARKLLDELSS